MRELSARLITSSSTRIALSLTVTIAALAPASVLFGAEWVTNIPMPSGRIYHSASLVPGGKVLVAGGGGTSYAETSADLYNSLTKTWTAAGPMNSSRRAHTAT